MDPQLSKFEEKGDKTLIGKSESLGVHLSDIWVEEPPTTFVRRLLQEDLKAWGYKVSSGKEPIQLNAQVNKFSLGSRAISAVEFQADGAIDVTVTVSRADGTEVYKGRYVGTCTRKTASEFPTSEYMEKVFGQCIDEYEKKVRSDGRLRAALSPT